MRNPSLPGPDGPGNLAAALAVAADERSRDLGVLVVFADEVHAARGVAKKHTSAPDAFLSIATGPLGRMLEGRPVLHTRVARRTPLPVPAEVAVRVPLLTAVLDDDPAVVEAVGGLADGLVVAAFGAGHLRPPVADAVAALVPRIPVVLSSRTGSGSVHTHTYGGPGSEVDLLGRGLVNAGHLDGLKSRLLLSVLLASGADRSRVGDAFAEHGGA
jgi:L-asparaginase